MTWGGSPLVAPINGPYIQNIGNWGYIMGNFDNLNKPYKWVCLGSKNPTEIEINGVMFRAHFVVGNATGAPPVSLWLVFCSKERCV